ncbi:MAG: coenzyme A pyrophosphatase [Planctomycetaceae bacterium]|nr:coenzyme A pyrophosphatase [Planctomycetaceae bacterium]
MDSFSANLPDRLRERLKQPLPDLRSCSEFVPELCYGRHEAPPAHDAKRAAVLLLLYPEQSDWRLPLTLRPETMQSHAGQVSFPGGVIEPGETAEQAAIRECREELGDTGERTEILGQLSPAYVFGSNFLVTPCVAWTPKRPDFIPNPAEVANLLEPSVVDLLDARHRGCHMMERRSVTFQVPHITYDNHRIWGATSLMLGQFLMLLADR